MNRPTRVQEHMSSALEAMEEVTNRVKVLVKNLPGGSVRDELQLLRLELTVAYASTQAAVAVLEAIDARAGGIAVDHKKAAANDRD